MKWFFGRQRPKHGRPQLDHIDAVYLRELGLNPEDFRDALEGRRTSLFSKPFRDAPPEK